MNKAKARIGILTGGGDCPGLNAVIRAVAKTAIHQMGMEVIGFLDGFRGLVDDESSPLTFDTVSNILSQGGTILGTSSKDNFFRVPMGPSQKVPPGKDRLPDALRTFRKRKLQGIICIGGDGTLTVAHHLHRHGIPVIGVPKTIDNDVRHTDLTFGFDSACTVATDATDRLRTTASSHHRVMVLEVMGRNAGWIALHAGLAGGGDAILIPEIPFSLKRVYDVVRQRSRRGRRYSIIVIAEGAHPKGSSVFLSFSPVRSSRPRLGGIGMLLSEQIEKETGLESRATVLGHLQRGGSPSFLDRVLATQFGFAAAGLASQRRYGNMVRFQGGKISTVNLSQVSGRPRNVPLNHSLITTARAVGSSFCE